MDDINREQKNQEKTPGLGRDHMLRDEDESEKRTVSDEKPSTKTEKIGNREWKENLQEDELNEKNKS